MNLFSELITAVQSDLTIGSESTLFDPTTVKSAINRAKRKAEGLFRWPELRDAKKTVTVVNQEYYDYPDNWQSDSLWKIMVGGVRYGETPDGSPLTFDDYLAWREDYPNATDKKWASQQRRYFIFPVPTVSNIEIDVWGQRVTDDLVNDSDTTIFSYSMPEGNEAIVLEAGAILKNKGEILQPVQRSFISGTQLLNIEAQNLLATAWGKIKENQAKFEKNQPFFEVPNFFSGRNTKPQRTGDFD